MTNKLRVGRTETFRKFNCPKCDAQLKEGTYSLTETGMVVCENIDCPNKFSFTYCDGCKKIDLTKNMRFIERQIIGMPKKVRCHVCENGKLSSIFCRIVPHTKQVGFDGKGNPIINSSDGYEDINVMGELIKLWENDSKFTVDMIGKGEIDRESLTHIPENFWKSDILLEGYEEVLLEAFCKRCSVDLMPLPDTTRIENYTHVCPNCGVYFRVDQEGVGAK